MAEKICVVTGAGAATAELLAKHGAVVLCADIDGAAAHSTADRTRATGAQTSAYAVDISDDSAARSLIEYTVSKYARLDVLHNNAGIGMLASNRIHDRHAEAGKPTGKSVITYL